MDEIVDGLDYDRWRWVTAASKEFHVPVHLHGRSYETGVKVCEYNTLGVMAIIKIHWVDLESEWCQHFATKHATRGATGLDC